jgi:hypothetical protein
MGRLVGSVDFLMSFRFELEIKEVVISGCASPWYLLEASLSPLAMRFSLAALPSHDLSAE